MSRGAAKDGFLLASDNRRRCIAVALSMRHVLVGSIVRVARTISLALVPAVCATLATLASMPGSLHAQSKVTGKWLVRYEHEVRSGHMGSGPSRVVTDSVHVTLRQKGDSIVGEWQAIASIGETPANPRTLIGVFRGETARLEIDPSVAATDGYFAEMGRELVEFIKEHVHGIQPTTAKLELSLRGDSLIGSRWSSSPDGTETTRRSLVGVREKP
jgi:hypothetical protein